MNNLPIPFHMYPLPSPDDVVATRPKRRQVKNACTNCQKACKKCDDGRPCLRCVKYGAGEECINSQRKERKKGIKRGPYKKRDGKGRAVSAPDPIPPVPSYLQMPLSPGYDQFASGSPPAYPYYVAQDPQHAPVPAGQDNQSALPFYPIFHAPFSAQPTYPHPQQFMSPFTRLN